MMRVNDKRETKPIRVMGSWPPRRRRPGPVVRYALVWVLAAALVVLLAISVIEALDRRGRPAPQDDAPAPAGVLSAASAAGCSFTHAEGPVERAGARDRPPVVGRADARPAPDGAYAQPPPVGALLEALAAGRVVIQYDPALTARERRQLEQLYAGDRRAVILTPDKTGMSARVAITSWRRVLQCPRLDDRVLVAIAKFRDRFRGIGPR